MTTISTTPPLSGDRPYQTVGDSQTIFSGYREAKKVLGRPDASSLSVRRIASTLAGAAMARAEEATLSMDVFRQCWPPVSVGRPSINSRDASQFFAISLDKATTDQHVLTSFVSLLQSSLMEAVSEFGMNKKGTSDGDTMLLVTEMYSEQECYLALPRPPTFKPAVGTVKKVKENIDLATMTISGRRVFGPEGKKFRNAVKDHALNCKFRKIQAVDDLEKALTARSGIEMKGTVKTLLDSSTFIHNVQIPYEIETALPFILTMSHVSGLTPQQVVADVQSDPARLPLGLVTTCEAQMLKLLAAQDERAQARTLELLADNSLIVSEIGIRLFCNTFDVAYRIFAQRIPDPELRVSRSLDSTKADVDRLLTQVWE